MQHSALLKFTPAAVREHKVPTIPVAEIPLWSITRSYYEMEQHVDDVHYKTLARRLGADAQTTRRWIMGAWSTTMLTMVDREDVMDQLATNRTYKSIADELSVDELSLRKWVKATPDALRQSEEFKAEMQIDQAKDWIKSASRPEEAKAAASLLTHAQWASERLYRTKYKPNAETPIMPMSFNFDLGQNALPPVTTVTLDRSPFSGITIDGSVAAVQSGLDPLPAVLQQQANHSDHGASGFREDFTHGNVAAGQSPKD